MEGSIRFSSFLKEMSSYYQCFSSTSRDSQILNCIEEFWCLQHMWNIGLFTTFHTAASSAIYWPSASAIPPFRNSKKEGSLLFGIPIWRDPSIWEFLFGGLPHFRNCENPTFFVGFWLFFVMFFAFSRTICMWNAIIAKKNGWFDLL